MKKIVCEMCDSTEFTKVDGMFVCQECGCRYTPEDARKLMVEVDTDNEPVRSVVQEVSKEPEFVKHTPDSPNRIAVSLIKLGHESIGISFVGLPKDVFEEGPDSAGGIGAQVELKNMAGKTIKYATVYLTPYNAVGDVMTCSVTHHATYGVEITGPIGEGEAWEGTCDSMWYNHTIVSAEIDRVEVIYMDETRELFSAEDVVEENILSENGIAVEVVYKAGSGAPQALLYTLDDSDRMTLMTGNSQTFYLTPGRHGITIRNPLMKKEYPFLVEGKKEILITGKAFSMVFSEK